GRHARSSPVRERRGVVPTAWVVALAGGRLRRCRRDRRLRRRERSMRSTGSPAVVVVHYRTPHLLARCLEALRGYPDVVVGDHASGDDDAARVVDRFEGVTLVAGEGNRGF